MLLIMLLYSTQIPWSLCNPIIIGIVNMISILPYGSINIMFTIHNPEILSKIKPSCTKA